MPFLLVFLVVVITIGSGHGDGLQNVTVTLDIDKLITSWLSISRTFVFFYALGVTIRDRLKFVDFLIPRS